MALQGNYEFQASTLLVLESCEVTVIEYSETQVALRASTLSVLIVHFKLTA